MMEIFQKKIEYFKKVFPIGTQKNFVDKALINGAGLNISQPSSDYPTVFNYEKEQGFFELSNAPIQFIFNADLEIENISGFKSKYLYEDGKTKEELFKDESISQ